MNNENINTPEAALATVESTGTLDLFSNRQKMKFVYDTAKILAASNIIPQNYQGKPGDCMIAIDIANRVGLSPVFVMQNLYVVKGKPSWAGTACKAMVENCGKFSKVKHVYFGEKGTDSRGCMLVATRISDGELVEGPEVTIAMAKAEGWTSNPKWRNMPELMLAYRSSAFFARVHCPETLMGLHTVDEYEDTQKAPEPAPNPFAEVADA